MLMPQMSHSSASPDASTVFSGVRLIAKGRSTVNVVPRPSSLFTEMVPPMFFTSAFTMGMPMPVPW